MSQTVVRALVGVSSILATLCIGCGWILGLDEYKPQDDVASTGFDGDGGGLASCVPAESATPVDDDCGVFVATFGNDTGAGIKQSPVATMKIATERAQFIQKPIYACAQIFQEAVKVPAGISIYGGLDCTAGWKYAGDTMKTTFAPAADLVPLTVTGSEETTQVTDVTAVAADAMVAGGSSIAVLVDGAVAHLVRVELVAGVGSDGDKGATPDLVGPSAPTDPLVIGNDGAAACTSAAETPGGAAKSNSMCNSSIGGDGGKGMELGGGAGADGQPAPTPNVEGFGLGGIGASGSQCKNGGSGNIGVDGLSGAGERRWAHSLRQVF